MAIKNSNLEVIGEYKDSHTKILHRCKKHNVDFLMAPTDILNGHGCKICASEKNKKAKTMSKEDFLKELESSNPDIELRGEYINLHTKTNFFCKKHGVEWETIPYRVKEGCGCPECRREKIIEKNTISENEFKERLQKISPFIKLVGEYTNLKTPTLFLCEKHNAEWKTTPECILQGCGCPKCKSEKISSALLRTNEEYLQEIKNKNLSVKPLEEYKGANTKIKHLCLIHNVIWDETPYGILQGFGCPKCANEKLPQRQKRTQDEYERLVHELSPFITVEEKYEGNNVPILHWCHKHDVKWKACPGAILSGAGCKECGKEKNILSQQKTTEQYILDLKKVNPDLEVLEEYNGAHNKILHHCKKCGYEWLLTPGGALAGNGCPQCKESRGEREIRHWLDQYGFKYESQYRFEDCRDKKALPFDFYLPEENVAIEYDGEQHFESLDYFGGEEAFELRKQHDRIKNEYCENHDIPLLRISYDEDIIEQLDNFLFI